MGYLRYDSPQALAAMNDLYGDELRLLQNLFLPSVKLLSKTRVGSRLRRRYDQPRTPLDRLIACRSQAALVWQLSRALRDRLDPFTLADCRRPQAPSHPRAVEPATQSARPGYGSCRPCGKPQRRGFPQGAWKTLRVSHSSHSPHRPVTYLMARRSRSPVTFLDGLTGAGPSCGGSHRAELRSVIPRDSGWTSPSESAVSAPTPADSSSPGETKLLGMTGFVSSRAGGASGPSRAPRTDPPA